MFAGTGTAANGLIAQDYFEIQQLYAHYNIAIDSGDAEGWAATFTPDGVFNTFAGHDALVGFVKTWREKLNGATRKHWNNNLQITGNSKEASGSVYLMLVDISTKPASIAGDCDLHRQPGQNQGRLALHQAHHEGRSAPAAPSAPPRTHRRQNRYAQGGIECA